MPQADALNGNQVLLPAEQQLLAELRELPPEATKELSEYVRFLIAHYTNPGNPDSSSPTKTADMLAGEKFQSLARQMAPTDAVLLEELAVYLVGRSLRWSYDDPASLDRSADLMGLDPFLRRESDAITKEFEVALNDGLEEPY